MLERLKEINGKTKKSKQGVVLVTILFILAIALIFIASALMLTTATRTRLYTRAEDNQARLTVTSAAESFYQALYMQEITDAQLLGLGGSSIRLVNEAVPGMSASDDTNCTFAYFTKNADNTMVIDFKTRIGDQVECIKMVLDYNEPKGPAHNFAHMLNVSKGGVLNRIGIGMTTGSMGTGTDEWRYSAAWSRYNSDDNSLIFRGSTEPIGSTQEQNYFYSNVIATGPYSPIDSNFFGDLVFWGSTASYELSNVKGSPIQLKGGSVYFSGNTASITNNFKAAVPGNYANCGEWFKGDGNVVFYDEAAQTITFEKDQNHANNSATLKFNTSSNTTLAGAAPTNKTAIASGNAYYDKAAKYKNKDYTEAVVGSSNNDLMTYAGIADEYKWAKNVGSIKNTTSLANNAILKNGGPLKTGDYTISGTMNTSTPITLDLSSGSYIFYITGPFTIEAGYFEIINAAGSENNVYFIICTGETFTIGHNNSDKLCGIISTNCYKDKPTEGGEYAYYRSYGNIDPTSCPHAFIYSMGTGGTSMSQLRFDSNKHAVCNAYVGLYPSASNKADDGTLHLKGGGSCMFYGRVTCAGVDCEGGAILSLPYCPQPGSDRNSTKPQEKYSDFKIFDYQYYTETPA